MTCEMGSILLRVWNFNVTAIYLCVNCGAESTLLHRWSMLRRSSDHIQFCTVWFVKWNWLFYYVQRLFMCVEEWNQLFCVDRTFSDCNQFCTLWFVQWTRQLCYVCETLCVQKIQMLLFCSWNWEKIGKRSTGWVRKMSRSSRKIALKPFIRFPQTDILWVANIVFFL